MKKLILTLIILVGLAIPGFPEETEVSPEVKILMLQMQITEYKTVALVMVAEDGIGFCSGSIIDNQKSGAVILTAKHCIDAKSVTYVDSILATDVIVSKDYDLALLMTKQAIPNKTAITFGVEDEPLHNIIYLIGYVKTKTVIYTGLTWLKAPPFGYYAKMGSESGCSGGGVFNNRGLLIGVVSKGVGDPVFMMNFETLSNVRDFLDKVNYMRKP